MNERINETDALKDSKTTIYINNNICSIKLFFCFVGLYNKFDPRVLPNVTYKLTIIYHNWTKY